MRKIVSVILLCGAFSVRSQTNQNPLASIQWTSQSKTVQWYRQQYPQLTNTTDDRLVTAIGNKFPQILKTDSVFSNEFASLTVSAVQFLEDEPADKITTRSKNVYQGVKIIRADPDGLTISYTNSTKALLIVKLQFDDLSNALKEKYHYNPQAAMEFQIRQRQGMVELRNQLGIIEAVASQADNQRIDEGLRQRRIEDDQKLNAQLVLAKQREAAAREKAADAAMIEAMKPPPQINMQQNVFIPRNYY